jgi:hypothetical protein
MLFLRSPVALRHVLVASNFESCSRCNVFPQAVRVFLFLLQSTPGLTDWSARGICTCGLCVPCVIHNQPARNCVEKTGPCDNDLKAVFSPRPCSQGPHSCPGGQTKPPTMLNGRSDEKKTHEQFECSTLPGTCSVSQLVQILVQ